MISLHHLLRDARSSLLTRCWLQAHLWNWHTKHYCQKVYHEHIHVASVIASKASLEYVKNHFPADKTTIWVGAVDEEINDHSYIVPGLGDAGDLAYGKKI